MKKLLTIASSVMCLALLASPARAQYVTGDLMIGFENGTTKDVLLDLGAAQNYVAALGGAPFAVNIGNLNAALIAAFGASPGTNANIFAAIFGNNNSNDPSNTLYASRTHSAALSGSLQSSRASGMSGVEAQYNNDFSTQMTLAINQDSSQESNSYLSQVTGGQVFQNYITERQFTLNSFQLDRVPSTTNGGGAATLLGTFNFTVDGNGNITGLNFNPAAVPEPSTYVLAALGGVLLIAAMRRTRKTA